MALIPNIITTKNDAFPDSMIIKEKKLRRINTKIKKTIYIRLFIG